MITSYKPFKWIFSPDIKEQHLKTVVFFCTSGIASISWNLSLSPSQFSKIQGKSKDIKYHTWSAELISILGKKTTSIHVQIFNSNIEKVSMK